ncbi:hypothetical protein ACI7RC_26740 [Brevibacillus sp. B_LB10_24]|uniref:hypothetical protein n=1 Tax=Brevibacillus sp. B_LB10_24 TaxID=3380645 RepID=UPI0038BC492A
MRWPSFPLDDWEETAEASFGICEQAVGMGRVPTFHSPDIFCYNEREVMVMGTLSDQAKAELFQALEGKQSGLFTINGKLVSVEVENFEIQLENDQELDIAQEIENDPELKASLTRYMNNPDMKRYSASELKEKRGSSLVVHQGNRTN